MHNPTLLTLKDMAWQGVNPTDNSITGQQTPITPRCQHSSASEDTSMHDATAHRFCFFL
jgi:hypothetical protein